MPNLNAALLAFLMLASAILGAAACYWAMRGQTVEVVEQSAPPINHPDGSVTAAKVTRDPPRMAAPTKPKGRDVRTFEVEVLPDPVVCPSTGERVQCAPVALRLDYTEDPTGLRGSVAVTGGEILDAADYPLAPWVRLADRRNVVQLQAYTDGTKAASYSRKVGRVWIGPALLLPAGMPAVLGATLGAEF